MMQAHQPRTTLLSRDDFRNGTFERDNFQCVVCGAPAVDAHHIIERRLFKAAFEKGGYFLDNGASLCEKHHIEAEKTGISCQTIRELCGIDRIILPHHFRPGRDYDKWGNGITPEGRLKGELYYEMSVRATLKDIHVLPYSVHSRAYRLPWSKTVADDPVLEDDSCFETEEVVVWALPEGAPFVGYPDGCLDENPERLEFGWQQKLAVLDADMRICGYAGGPQPYLSALWVENDCADWAETRNLAAFLDWPMPAVLYEGIYDKNAVLRAVQTSAVPVAGYTLRVKKAFRMFDIGKSEAQAIL